MFAEIFQTNKFNEKLRSFSLSIEEFLTWVVETDTSSSLQVVSVLKRKMRSHKTDGRAFIFEITDPALLREARPEPVRQAQRASKVVQHYGGRDGGVSESFFTLIGQRSVSPTLLRGKTLLQSVFTKRRKVVKNIPSQYVPAATEALLLFHGNAYVSGCLQERRLHAKVHRKTRSRNGVTVQLATRA